MPDSELRRKALGYLRAGNVTVTAVARETDPADGTRTVRITASVQGHMRVHVVDGLLTFDAPHYVDGVNTENWTCTCEHYLEPTCPHRAAVAMVTGGHTDARPVPTSRV